MALVTAFAQLLIVGALTFLVLFVLALAASYGIGQLLGNSFYGFLIVGAFVSVVTIIVYLMRKKINKPIISKFSKSYFDES